MTTIPEKYKEIVPIYLNGRLSEAETKEFEAALAKFTDLREEVAGFSEIMDTYQDIAKEIPAPAGNLFYRTLTNIKSQEKKVQAVIEEKSSMSVFFKNLFFSPRFSWAVAGVQAVIIIAMISGAFQDDNNFNTLTISESECVDCFMVNVVFNADAREKEIRSLLNNTGAEIIKGPDKDGLYIIRIEKKGKSHKEIILEFNNSNIIRHVAERY